MSPLKVIKYLYPLYVIYSYIISENQDNILAQSFKYARGFYKIQYARVCNKKGMPKKATPLLYLLYLFYFFHYVFF